MRAVPQKVAAWLKPRLTRLALAVVAGLLLCASFPPLAWWWAAILGVALLVIVLRSPDTTAAGGFGYGFLTGLAFYLPLLPWISGLVGAVPWVALSIMCAVFPALFGVLAVTVRRLPGWPLWFAAVWMVAEWLKTSVPFGGFPWGVLGFSQTNGPLLPLTRLGGVPLVSFAVVLVAAGAVAIGLEVAVWWRRSSRSRRSAADHPPAVILPGLCITAVLLATAVIHPAVRQSSTGADGDPAVTVAAVQGNVPRLGLDFNAQRRAVLDNHVEETLRLAAAVRAGRAPQPQFVVWPENSSDIDPLANADAGAQIERAAQAIGAPILVGAVLAHPDSTRDNPAALNTVLVWDPVAGPAERHDKKIIQPFGEYLPWRGFFAKLSSYADRAGYFVPGDGTGVVHAAGVPIGVTTCWEVIFDRAARESVLAGAQVLAVPTNNATFNEAMSEQLLAFSRARAVEHNRYVVVAGTTGISAIIAPDGRELARTEWFQPAFLDQSVRLKTALTPATRWGPIVVLVLVAMGITAALAGAWLTVRHNGGLLRPIRKSVAAAGSPPTTASSGPTKESDALRSATDVDTPGAS
ncbi:MAG: apolipoprotein N-acyltransferase [Mycobacterium sp.]